MPNRLRTTLVAASVIAIGYLALDHLVSHPNFRLPKDFLEYWAAGSLNLRGENPYDPALLLAQQCTADPARTEAVMMWNPPWSLAAYMPLGLLSAKWAAIVWLGLQLAAIRYACILLWRAFEGPPRLEFVATAVGLTFGPALWTLVYGQNTGLLLLGLAGFLSSWKSGKPRAAGAYAALTGLKPHLLAAFGILFVLDAIRYRGRVALAVGVGIVAASLAISLAANPHVIVQYRSAIQNPGVGAVPLAAWDLPVASYLLRTQLAPDRFWVQFLPAALACLGFAIVRIVRGNRWDWTTQLPVVVLVSVLATPYGGWIFDLVVLLVPVLRAAVWVVEAQRWLVGSALAVGLAIATFVPFVQGGGLYDYWWVAPLVLLLYALAATPLRTREKSQQ